ncbi:MAG: SDR family NAD(P)-dependent oxidoreductase, partial [Planctomycetes bacterium]|nr:SDR family NAD(P)-dependent oxidoreductase [Planctomycetota bacterium]
MNKSILIVGASTGIGRDCVEHLHAQGYKVIATVRTAGDAPAC